MRDMIGLQGLCGHRPPVGAAPGAIRPAGEAVLCRCVTRREIHSWLMDMDGVLVREESLIPGADRFIAALRRRELPFLLLTNNSIYTRRDLAARLRTSGLEVPEESIWTSALATAGFLADQRPGGSAFVIGESGLTTALHERGLHDDRARPRLRRARRDAHLLLRAHHERDPARSSPAPASSPPTPTRPGRARRARCRPPARWRR